jgi:prophage regulatory protein
MTNTPNTEIETLLPLKAVIARTSLSRAFLYDLAARGLFPKPVRLSMNRVAWTSSAVNAWIAAKIAAA